MKSNSNNWVSIPNPRPQARCRLYCLPHAGGGAALFRTWPEALPSDVEVCPIQLPGREMRFAEPRFTSITNLVRTLVPIILPHLQKPFAVFGYSMGGLIGFELIRELRRLNAPGPIRLFIAARQAPQLVETHRPIHKLPDQEFFEALHRRYGGIPAGAFNNQEIRNLFIPLLRADVEMIETYRHEPGPPLDCPISVFGGRSDSIAEADLRAWQQQSSRPLFLQMMEGSHFFMHTAQDELLAVVSRQLSADLAQP
jgi:medium-chain acyl-[acyl-carrier-protein] hydrolase